MAFQRLVLTASMECWLLSKCKVMSISQRPQRERPILTIKHEFFESRFWLWTHCAQCYLAVVRFFEVALSAGAAGGFQLSDVTFCLCGDFAVRVRQQAVW